MRFRVSLLLLQGNIAKSQIKIQVNVSSKKKKKTYYEGIELGEIMLKLLYH